MNKLVDSTIVRRRGTDEGGQPATGNSEAVTPRPPVDRRAWIAITAYAIAERRGFAPGHELEEWLEAEKQVHVAILGEGRTV